MGSRVRVIIPWRGGCQYREGALRRVVEWWESTYPMLDIGVSHYPMERGPWCKGMAIWGCGQVADDEIIIIADADVVCDQVHEAVAALDIRRDAPFWGMPHRDVYRLNEQATALYVQNQWKPDATLPRRDIQPYLQRSYAGYPGGGLVVIRGWALNHIPIDPRFTGYGQEDHSWALALSRLVGAPWRGHGILWHLWHPPQPRIRPGIGSLAGINLWHRYRCATTPGAMWSLVEESRAELLRNA